MKKKLPLRVLRALEEITKDKGDMYIQDQSGDYILKFEDKEPGSSFHFTFVKIDAPQGKTRVLINYCPKSENSTLPFTYHVGVESIKAHFEKWHNLMLEYEKESPLFDDPITQHYYDELEPKFTIIDEDAHTKPYDLQTQKALTKVLDNAKKMIETQVSEGKIDNNKDKEETIELIDDTKRKITKFTKNQVVHRLRKIAAKVYKVSLEAGEKLLVEIMSETLKKLAQGN